LQSRYLLRGFGIESLKLQLLENGINTEILFTHLTGLENHVGKKFDLGLLERMSNEGQLPSDVSLSVQSKLSISRVPLDDIKQIERATSRNMRWIVLGVGFAVDITLVAAVSSAFKGRWK
jgi:hypothetical protein